MGGLHHEYWLEKIAAQKSDEFFADHNRSSHRPSLLRIAMINELTTSTLLFLGLATRLMTLPLLGMICVIQIFVYPNAWPDHVPWGSVLIFLLTRGPGSFSIDYVIERYVTRTSRAE